jgi:hypothetical protein
MTVKHSGLTEVGEMNDDLKGILTVSLMGAIGFMWVIGGIALILAGFEEHWALGWLALFVWVWGCGAAALYFKVQRFFN